MKYFEDLKVGAARTLGSYTFTAENIKRFARKYDPQPFHLDEEAAKNSLFGALCASGWHTGAACMRVMVDAEKRDAEQARARGEEVVSFGPSPGFKNLKWLKPVFVGDTITYSSEITGLRELASRSDYGLMHGLTIGVNQNGERVYQFESTAFIPRRPK